MEITAWLRDLSVPEYQEVFLDNAINVEVLPYLTEADLERMGVRLGHRKRMLRAIAALGCVRDRSRRRGFFALLAAGAVKPCCHAFSHSRMSATLIS
jgi:hypothetical protein